MKVKLIFIIVLSPFLLFGNNISVENIIITNNNPTQGYAMVQFDLSWENSWRVNSAPDNWDAAWVFVKYKVSGGVWQHAYLNDSEHSVGLGSAGTIEIGLVDDLVAFNSETNPGVGAIIYRSTTGTGLFSAQGMQLRWNYLNNLPDLASVVELRVFAIEMVMVKGGNFFLGDGVSFASFRNESANLPCLLSASGATVRVNSTNFDDSQLLNSGIWVDGDDGISRSSPYASDMNPDYPTGYRGFYSMKYEISQGQYRDFLNCLTRQQQNSRTGTDISGTAVINRYVMSNSSIIYDRNGLRCDSVLPAIEPIVVYCDLDGDGKGDGSGDGEWVACNYLSWEDGIAYLDWSGLRPMTELEFEKACRGPLGAVGGEFSWGTAIIAENGYSLFDEGSVGERISVNYSGTAGNALYGSTLGSILGPARVGIFAGNVANDGRVRSGSGFSGVFDLSGNLWEQCVTLGNISGRNYKGLHGNGILGPDGLSDVSWWPGQNGVGGGFRGGSWHNSAPILRVSDRFDASLSNSYRSFVYGFRGVRGVSPTNSGY